MTRILQGLTLIALTLTLCLPLSAATISGVVTATDEDKPLTEAQIYAIGQVFDDMGGMKVNTYGPLRPNLRGAFLLSNLPAGRYTLFALAPGFEMERQTVEMATDKDEREVTLTLTPASSISGQIRDKNDQPLANTPISFVAASPYCRIEGTTTTRGDGSYTIYLAASYRQPIGALTIQAFPGQESQITAMTDARLPSSAVPYTLSVKAPGYAFADRAVFVQPGREMPNVHFTLTDKSTTVTGKVTADDGRTPVPNAHVRLMRTSGGAPLPSGYQPFTQTGNDGAWTFTDVAPGAYQVYASASEFTATGSHTTQVTVTSGAPTTGVHLMLTPAASIEGTIFEGDGADSPSPTTPLRNQFVEIRAQMVTEFGRASRGVSMQIQDGKYIMSHLEPGTYEILVFVERMGVAQVRTTKVGKGEKVKDFNLRLGEEPLLTLTVRSATDRFVAQTDSLRHRSPVSNALIYVRTPDASSWWPVAKTDAQGTLRIGGLTPQRYFFWAMVSAGGFSDYPRQNDEGVAVNIARESGQYQAEVVLRGPASAVGRVVDEQKKPVAGAQVQMSPSSGGIVQMAVTDINGAFRVAPLRGDVYRLTVIKDGYEPYADNVVVKDSVENKLDEITVTFLGFGAIRGRVVSMQGTTRVPVKAAQVSYRRQRFERSLRSEYVSAQGVTVLTDETGAFKLENVPAGLYDLLVSPGNGPVIVRELVSVRRNETTPVSEIVIPPTGTLTGKIHTPDGNPVPFGTEVIVGPPGMSGGLVPIMVSADSRNHWMTDQYAGRVNPNGTFRIAGILPGKYEVVVRGAGLLAPAPQLVEIKATQTANLNFTTPRGGKIVGRVVNLATLQPIAGANVYLYDPVSNDTKSGWTDAQGNYTIENVRPGVTRVVCRMRGFALATRFDVLVEENETAIIDFLLTPGGSISGRVKGRLAQRAHPSSLQVAANSNLNMSSYVRPDGSYKIENLPPGVYSVDLFLGNAGVLSVSGVVVEEGKETTGIDFELPQR